MKDPVEFFPGDLPLFDLLVYLCALLAGLCAVVVVLAFATGRRRGGVICAIIACISLWPMVEFWTQRHTAPWRGLQHKLDKFEAEARSALARCHDDHQCAVDYFDRTYGTTTYRFTPEHRPVRLFLRPTRDAIVGVDFGHGCTAVFNTKWMIATYTD